MASLEAKDMLITIRYCTFFPNQLPKCFDQSFAIETEVFLVIVLESFNGGQGNGTDLF